jgi:hypothetical protein
MLLLYPGELYRLLGAYRLPGASSFFSFFFHNLLISNINSWSYSTMDYGVLMTINLQSVDDEILYESSHSRGKYYFELKIMFALILPLLVKKKSEILIDL